MTRTGGSDPRAGSQTSGSRETGDAADGERLVIRDSRDLSPLRDIAIPLTSRAVFWQPRHVAPSPLLAHIPFLFWLTETARPARVVQLGLGDGVGFMALCQAIDKLGLDSMCMGLDLDTGARPGLSDRFAEDHATLYSDFSFILDEEIPRAARHLQGMSVDMLVLNAPLDADRLADIQASWQPLLSDQGLLLVCDPRTTLADPAAQHYHDMLLRDHPAITFPRAAARLDVVLIGDNQPDRLRRMAQLGLGMPGHLATQQVFSRLGLGLEKDQATRKISADLAKAKAALSKAQSEIAEFEEERARLRAEVTAAQESEAAQTVQMAQVQAQLYDLQSDLSARAEAGPDPELAAVREELALCRAELDARDSQLDTEMQNSTEAARQIALLTEQKTTLEALLEDHAAARLALEDALRKEAAAHQIAEKARRDLEAAQQMAQGKLQESLDKRLALWEAHQALKAQYQDLLSQAGQNDHMPTDTDRGADPVAGRGSS